MLLALLLAAQPAAADAPPPPCRMAVLHLDGRGLDPQRDPPALARLAAEGIAGEVARYSGCTVLSQSDIETMANVEASRQACGDDGDSCLAELGSALGVDRIVSGTISRVDDEFVISVRVLNMKTAEVDARAEVDVDGAGDVRAAAARAGRLLCGVDDAPTPLALAGYGTVVGGVVTTLVGAILVGHAESQLTTAAQKNKEVAAGEGYAGLAVAGVGLVVAAVGAGLAVAGAP